HFTYYTNSSPTNDSNLSQVQSLVQQLNALDTLHRLGLTPTQINSLYAPPDLSTVDVQPPSSQDTRSESEIVAGYLLAYAGDILIFVAVLLYGMGVAMGVGEEKGSRVMEILVNAATPLQLMAGKIVGIGAAGLTQMAAVVAVGIGSFLLQIPLQAAIFGPHGGNLTFSVTSAAIPVLLFFLLYFILGFLLYSTIMAGAGSLVKRQEEARNAVQLPMMLMMGGYIAGEIGIYSANSTWMKVLSYIPFFTPTTMIVRIAGGQVALWEILITIPLMLVTIALCAWISARIYRSGILMYGQKPSLRQVVKLMRQ
ncbi:MAG TPA: ABC transporter permease, partial [Ktedonobacteraceae bacterium]